MDWSKAEVGDNGRITVPSNWIHLHYYEAINLLFRIENSVRVFAYAVLKSDLGPDWINTSLSTDDSQQTSIGAVGKRRLAQAKQFAYLGYTSPCPLLYLSMGELVQLMFSDSYWKYFATYFPGKKETMKLKLDEIITIRNSLAHFRPIREDDVDVIRQNAKHALMGIEKFLDQLTRCNIVVPSNSTDGWYNELKPLGTDNVVVQLHEAGNGEWVSLIIDFTPPIISEDVSDFFLDCRTIRLNTPAISKVAPELVGSLVYFTENNYRSVSAENRLRYKKHIELVFRRSTLAENTTAISGAFRKLLLLISEETALLTSDDVARGSLLSVEQVWGHSSEQDGRKTWSLNLEALESTPGEDDAPEYWGDMGWFGTEFITSRSRYPWMPSKVSNSDFG